MPRYILIDNCSGIIWADVIASNPKDAAVRADAIHGELGRFYQDPTPIDPRSNDSGYHVYQAPRGYQMFIEQSADPEAVATVQMDCPYVAFVGFVPAGVQVQADAKAEAAFAAWWDEMEHTERVYRSPEYAEEAFVAGFLAGRGRGA